MVGTVHQCISLRALLGGMLTAYERTTEMDGLKSRTKPNIERDLLFFSTEPMSNEL